MLKEDNLIGTKVKHIFTDKLTCLSCKRSFTVPIWGSNEVGECEFCGNTSFNSENGRLWGPKHRYWEDWVKSVYHLDDENRITEETLNELDDCDDLTQYLDL